MSLVLKSTLDRVESDLRQFDEDGHLGKDEFKKLRDIADERLNRIASIDARDFQAAADKLVETMRLLAVRARDDESFKDQRAALKEAMEYQLGYVVAGYEWATQTM